MPHTRLHEFGCPLMFFRGMIPGAALFALLFFCPGHLLSYTCGKPDTTESLAGANWSGDINTEGGLDAGMPGDRAALVASADNAMGFPPETTQTISLSSDYSINQFVDIVVGYRTNNQQTKIGMVYIDNVFVGSCPAYVSIGGQLRAKRFTVPSAKLPLKASAHVLKIKATNDTANPTDFFEIDALAFQRLGSGGSTELPPQNWLIVCAGNATPVEQKNVEVLKKRVDLLLGQSITTVSASALTPSQKQNNDLIIAGSAAASPFIANLLSETGLDASFNGKPAFQKEQGYGIGVYPGKYAPGRKVILAAGQQAQGAAYAMSHLRANLMIDQGFLYLSREGSVCNTQQMQEFQTPDRERRAIYYNIAYGFTYSPATPDTWNKAQWEQNLEDLMTARLTHVYFFLWGNIELCFPKSPISNTLRNQQLHQNLQYMIDYAHRLGLKTGFFISPTMVPQDIWQANPAAQAVNPYPGYSVVSPCATDALSFNSYSWANTWELMHDVWDNEMEWFKACDEFQIWFYDPGGSFDTVCKATQAQVLREQVVEFGNVAKAKNPATSITVSCWPIWALEPYYGISYRNQFFNELITAYGNPGYTSLTIYDSIDHPDTTIKQARPLGFPVGGFIFPTNVESGYTFTIPMLQYLKSAVVTNYGSFTAKDLPAAYFMRLEAAPKVPNTWFASSYIWSWNQTARDVVLSYARWAAFGNQLAADLIAQAMLVLEEFCNLGAAAQNMETKGAQIESLLNQAVALLTPAQQAQIEWLKTTGKVMRIYGKACENPGNTALLNALKEEFRATLQASPMFASYLGFGYSATFDRNVSQLTKGWNTEHF
ncbi:MAG: hypothetical protein NTY46_04590 [Candidatus Sumerlaeota bacterium]|nr:hypothetical protein [Candidatus Sumerlaeota bacterium]